MPLVVAVGVDQPRDVGRAPACDMTVQKPGRLKPPRASVGHDNPTHILDTQECVVPTRP